MSSAAAKQGRSLAQLGTAAPSPPYGHRSFHPGKKFVVTPMEMIAEDLAGLKGLHSRKVGGRIEQHRLSATVRQKR